MVESGLLETLTLCRDAARLRCLDTGVSTVFYEMPVRTDTARVEYEYLKIILRLPRMLGPCTSAEFHPRVFARFAFATPATEMFNVNNDETTTI